MHTSLSPLWRIAVYSALSLHYVQKCKNLFHSYCQLANSLRAYGPWTRATCSSESIWMCLFLWWKESKTKNTSRNYAMALPANSNITTVGIQRNHGYVTIQNQIVGSWSPFELKLFSLGLLVRHKLQVIVRECLFLTGCMGNFYACNTQCIKIRATREEMGA